MVGLVVFLETNIWLVDNLLIVGRWDGWLVSWLNGWRQIFDLLVSWMDGRIAGWFLGWITLCVSITS